MGESSQSHGGGVYWLYVFSPLLRYTRFVPYCCIVLMIRYQLCTVSIPKLSQFMHDQVLAEELERIKHQLWI